MDKYYTEEIHLYVTEDNYIGEVDGEEHLAELNAAYREVESFSLPVSQETIDKVLTENKKSVTVCAVCSWDNRYPDIYVGDKESVIKQIAEITEFDEDSVREDYIIMEYTIEV